LEASPTADLDSFESRDGAKDPAGKPSLWNYAPALAVGLAGLFGIAQFLLSWLDTSIGCKDDASSVGHGSDYVDGRLILGLGIAAVMLSSLWVWQAHRRSSVAAIAAAGTLVGLAILVLSVGDYSSMSANIARYSHPSTNECIGFSAIYGLHLYNVNLGSSIGIGLFVAMAGGLVGTMGGVAGLLMSGGKPLGRRRQGISAE
jgi:hypothetical protein